MCKKLVCFCGRSARCFKLCVIAMGLTTFLALGLVAGYAWFATKTVAKPTVYSYYAGSEVSEGLKTTANTFTLNGKTISLLSGSIHYFRVHPHYWRDRLRKLRAAGFVAVETYVPWNLHEPYNGTFDFGYGENDMSEFLDIRKFLQIAKEEDLLAIVRPGPYICAEWEFGGLPSWLLRDQDMRVRTSDGKFMTLVERYFSHLLPLLKDMQFSNGAGPIIAFQIENEYGNTKEEGVDIDKKYLEEIKDLFEKNGLVELFFTSDTPTVGREYGALPGVLQTANLNEDAKTQLTQLKKFQQDKPAMVMEYWTGWFDHWGEAHHTVSKEKFASTLEEILSFPSGVNFYMFHGGTSFGFMNGGNIFVDFPFYMPDISSYDYDAPLSEAGDYTLKYYSTRAILTHNQKVDLHVPEIPHPETKKVSYEPLAVTGYLKWTDIISQVDEGDVQKSHQPMYMEQLSVNNGSGQSYGYVVYRKNNLSLRAGSTLEIRGKVNGAAMVVVDGQRVSKPLKSVDDLKGFGYWCTKNGVITVPPLINRSANNTLDLNVKNETSSTIDIIVENPGRNNFGKLSKDFNEVRGLTDEQIVVDGHVINDFEIYAVQFKGNWVRRLTSWKTTHEGQIPSGPVLVQFVLSIAEPADTFLDMRDWVKGIVFINGFNLGRYSKLGPQRTLYAPAPLFREGRNEILVFEHYQPAPQLRFSKESIFQDSEVVLKAKLF